ncbi:hypothetical protein QBC47DRAFT_178103 [Echria macrotheca]|uniref:FAD-binding FR-type domain-containing protein n=1 Tax=Echria macrotheca TaxID=438768 RepID=A0AAJ0FBE5_9PEZI|nr:hypothetical protein QBC47DRAFT_178103 [Echria macrotheca]
MGWPYQFLDLNDAEKQLRREALDRYAFYAQISPFVPVALALSFRVAKWALKSSSSRSGSYSAIPNSPSLKSQRLSPAGGWSSRLRKLQWWLEGNLVDTNPILGHRDQWVLGISYLGWLLLLCVLGTGNDYLHFTKRLGLVATSQYPIQYLMSLKALNPFAFAFRSSHEHINRYHRVLGRIMAVLVTLHVILYINFLAQVGTLGKRLKTPLVASGVVSFILLNLLYTTALRPLRQVSYRLFFIVHLVVAFLTPVTLSRHAAPARLFLAEAVVVFIADLISRKLDTVTGDATLESIPGTNLVKITASIPFNKINRFRLHPGSHVYLSIPAAARRSSDPASISQLLFEFLFNPFTVASVDQDKNDITLVARHRGGPMTRALARFAGGTKVLGPVANSAANASSSREETKIPLSIEGPYGVSTRFPNLSGNEYDRILLVAGGVGATFTVPLYQSIVSENPNARVEMIWAVRSAGDATWAVMGQDGATTAGSKGLLDDENVQIFLTGDVVGSSSSTSANGTGSSGVDGEVEMGALYRDRRRGKFTTQHNRKRPDLKKIVDETFKHGVEERVAVLVCGPHAMAKELREHVCVWVDKGRTVWWHNESFGY